VLYQEEVEALILRLASSFPARKDQLLFLINNYDVVMSIIIERTRDDSKVQTFFLQCTVNSGNFVRAKRIFLGLFCKDIHF
jgi:hypothetical protein